MKTKIWLVLSVMISTGVLADQPPTNAPPSLSTNTLSPKPATKKNPAPKKPAAPSKTTAKKPPAGNELRTVPLVPGLAKVVANRVNVRGRAGLIGERIGGMTNGESVT